MWLVLMLLAAGPRELNDAGMKAYRAKDYVKAAEQFEAALAAEPEVLPTVKEKVEQAKLLALVHHNLACVNALLRAQGKVCQTDSYRTSIVEHLKRSVELDPSRLERATSDPDLQSVRDTLGFQSLLGLSIERDIDLLALLPRVRWWSEGAGVYGSLGELQFRADGTVESKTRSFDDEGKPRPSKTVQGKWKLSGRNLSIEWAGSPKKTSGRVTTDGLELDGARWHDSPSECDA